MKLVFCYIENLTVRECWEIIVLIANLGLLFNKKSSANVESRPRLDSTPVTIIYYHSLNKRAIKICFIVTFSIVHGHPVQNIIMFGMLIFLC